MQCLRRAVAYAVLGVLEVREAVRPRERPPGDRVIVYIHLLLVTHVIHTDSEGLVDVACGLGGGTTTGAPPHLVGGFGRTPTARAALTTNWFVTTSMLATTSGVDTRSCSCMCRPANPGMKPRR